jgi:hypothetical protein
MAVLKAAGGDVVRDSPEGAKRIPMPGPARDPARRYLIVTNREPLALRTRSR